MSQTLPERRSQVVTERWEPFSELEQITQRMRRMLDQTLGGGWPSPLVTEAPGWPSLVEDVGEELVEEAAATEAVRHPLLSQIELAEVFRFLRPVRAKPDPGRDCRSPVTLAKVLDGHLNPLSLGR